MIYGDTDSIMINTAVPSRDEFESPAALLGDADARDSPVAQKVGWLGRDGVVLKYVCA